MRSCSENNMKKILSIFFLLIAAVTYAQKLPPKPNPPKLVNDFTNTLTSDQTQALESKLDAYDDSTTVQIAVVIISTVDGDDIAQYNVALGRAWGVGGKEFNNGVVLLIAKDDRRMNIATGYGAEGALPDVTAKRIIEDEIKPYFKGNDYYSGINNGVDKIMKALKGEYKAPAGYNKGKGGFNFGRIIFAIFIIIIILSSFFGGRGGGGSYMSRRGAAGWIIPTLLSGGGGGGWSGGGGGGSSGGGGFGGFGGGSFGGGGASGSW